MKERQSSPSVTSRRRDILRAALEELASADYGGLSIERVAARAGVNKTTIYRQWPTKAALVRAALETCAPCHQFGPSTGSLRGDLMRLGRMVFEFATSCEGQGIARLCSLAHPEPELAEMARELDQQRFAEISNVLEASVERGELAADVDKRLLVQLVVGALHLRLFVRGEHVDDVIIGRIVDMAISGVSPEAADAVAPPRRSQRRRA